MSRHIVAWLAWSLWAACVTIIALSLLLDFLTPSIGLPTGLRPEPSIAVLTGILSLAYPTVGALIVSRLPANPIGWIFCGMGLLFAVRPFSVTYADYALLVNPALPGEEYVAWFCSWEWFALPTLAIFLVLVFPDGRLLSRKWRIVTWCVLLGAALTALADALWPGNLNDFPLVENPFGVLGVIGGGLTTYFLFAAIKFFGTMLLLLSLFAALISLMVRLHRARGDERQQIKWFMYTAVPLTVFGSVLNLNLVIIAFSTTFLSQTVSLLPSNLSYYAIDNVATLAGLFVPVFTYVAILKYRLYDIDLVINRALVYGSLTALLALIYFGGVTATQAIVQALTSQEELPQLVVVVSTLVIAALFNPLRRRIQSFIDRRFYRRKYDARKTLEAFSAHMREETDLEALSDDLVGVVSETMQPAHVSLWLRPDTVPKSEQVA
jgi:hypothetical protein